MEQYDLTQGRKLAKDLRVEDGGTMERCWLV